MRTRTAESNSSPARHYIGRYGTLFVVIGVFFLTVVIYQTYSAYETAKASAATDANNLALVLESKLNADFAPAERTVSQMVDEIDPEAMRVEMVSRYRPQIERWLKSEVNDISSASALRYFAANGDRLYTSVEGELPINVADRKHFQLNKADPANSTIYSDVLLGRATGRVSMYVTKAIRARDGTFLGIASLGLDLTSIREHFHNLDLGKGGAVALRRLDDGAFILRFPDPVDTDNKTAPEQLIRQAILSNGPVRAISMKSPVDGTQRLYGYRRVGAYPLFVTVGIAEDDYMAQWRRETATLLAGTLLFLSILSYIFFRLASAELQRSKSESELRTSEGRLALAAEAGDVGMWDLDPVTGAVSQSFRHDKILGYAEPQEQWSFAKFLSHVIPEDRESVERKVQESSAGKHLHFDCRIMRADQVERWIAVTGRAIPDERGKPNRLMGTVTDITERKDAEETLRLQEEIIRSMAEGVCLIQAGSGTILLANPKFENMFGYGKDELTGKPVGVLNAPANARPEEIARQIMEVLTKHGTWNGDIENVRKDGTRIWCHATVSTMEHRKFGQVWISIHQDITERKRADEEIRRLNAELEQRVVARTAELNASVADLTIEVAERKRIEKSLLAANHELEAFSYSISHDLRTPLRGISGYASIIEKNYEEVLDEAGRNMLRRVRRAAQEMGELIEDLLGLSHLTRAVLNVEAVDLSAIARAVADKLEAGEPGRNVTLAIQPGLEVRGDPGLLTVVLENLLGNSWKFTHKHERARIEVGVTTRDGGNAYFVRDDGAGFDMAYAADLFTPFHRLHDARDFPGSGIGLATVQRIVERHGGRLWAEAAVEQGATFYFTLST